MRVRQGLGGGEVPAATVDRLILYATDRSKILSFSPHCLGIICRQEARKMKDLEQLLDHVPVLVKAYGKWPSFAYLLVATVRGVVLAGGVILLYHLLR
jgi:hypothetical protein